MGVNWSVMVKLPCQDIFSVPVTVLPVVSQPGAPAYGNRGIFDSGATDVPLTDGSIFSDQRTILDIRNAEYPVVPMQGDRITIPLNSSDESLGEYEVQDTSDDGGGQTTLTLRKYEPSKP